MDIKIYTLTHKKFNVPPDPLYVPLQVGSEEKEDLGYLCDNTGENISALNCYYSELTGLYWIWKNDHETEYVGTCHYRRFLLNEQEKIYEYLHHEDIAEDVFAYYLVYKKYQDDYGIDDILNGNVSSTIYARLFNADFDERVSVVNLVMDGLLRQVNVYSFEKHCTDLWFSFLKEYRKDMDSSYLDHTKAFMSNYRDQLQTELLSVSQKHEYEFVLNNIQKVMVDESLDPKSRFDSCTKPFFEQKEKMEKLDSQLKLEIENAFEFMENAFKNGQEMTIFVTNLTMSSEMALYLSSHTIDIYEKYKQLLLIGTQKARLLDELAH